MALAFGGVGSLLLSRWSIVVVLYVGAMNFSLYQLKIFNHMKMAWLFRQGQGRAGVFQAIHYVFLAELNKFSNTAPELKSPRNSNINCVRRRRGLKELKLEILGRNPYKVPCSVFSSSDLVELFLSFCIIKSGCFTNIQDIHLQKVTFDSSVVLTTPLLTTLVLQKCRGVLHFDISAPKLESLLLCDNDYLNLKPFLTCTGIDYAYLHSSKENTYFEGCESFCLVKPLAAWPRITDLDVDGFCFKYLATGSIPCILDQLNLRYFTIRDLKLDSELMPWILCILKNSPLLHTFEIFFDDNDLNGMSDDIDESTSSLDFQMDQLHTVIMEGFTATSNELVLAKNLLHCAPVLEKLIVKENDELDPKEQVRILKNLLSLQHAFPKARIVFGPNLVDP